MFVDKSEEAIGSFYSKKKALADEFNKEKKFRKCSLLTHSDENSFIHPDGKEESIY